MRSHRIKVPRQIQAHPGRGRLRRPPCRWLAGQLRRGHPMPALGRGNPRSSSAMRHRAPAHANGNIQLLRPRRVGAAAGYTTEGVTLSAGEDSERTRAEPPTSDPL